MRLVESRAPSNDKVANLLEGITAANEQGDYAAICFVALRRDGETEKAFSSNSEWTPATMVGALELAKEFVIRKCVTVDTEDVTDEY